MFISLLQWVPPVTRMGITSFSVSSLLKKNEDHPIPVSIGKIDCPIPPEGLYLFEQKGCGKWTICNMAGSDQGQWYRPKRQEDGRIIMGVGGIPHYVCASPTETPN